MKKIFVLDTMFSYGHKKFNYFYINLLKKYFHIIILNDGKYYNGLKGENVELLDIHTSLKGNNALKARWNIIKTFVNIRKSGALSEINHILVMGYDTLSFPAFFAICHPKTSIYTFQHHNIDETDNNIKKIVFMLYKNKMTHFVLEESFVEQFRKKCNIKSQIVYIPHYLSKLGFCEETKLYNRSVIAMSNSNDEKKIEKLIELDRNGYLNELAYKIVTKSKIYDYNQEKLEVISGYIPDEIYEKNFFDAKAVLILFPDSYDIRFSCTLLEALVNYKIVIGYDIPFVLAYKKKYPKNVYSFHTFDELLNILKELPDVNFDKQERELLVKELSCEKIEETFRRIFDIYEYEIDA